MKILNMSPTSKNYKYIIYREVNGVNWFYGADNDINICSEIVAELGSNARIVESSKCEF